MPVIASRTFGLQHKCAILSISRRVTETVEASRVRRAPLACDPPPRTWSKRQYFSPHKVEESEQSMRLYDKEFHDLYRSYSFVKIDKFRILLWAEHLATIGETRKKYRVLVVTRFRKQSLWRPRRVWQDNSEMDLEQKGYEGRRWMVFAQDLVHWQEWY
jgi:hypothetical protein